MLGWAQPFVTLVDQTVERGFARESAKGLFEVSPSVKETLSRLKALRDVAVE